MTMLLAFLNLRLCVHENRSLTIGQQYKPGTFSFSHPNHKLIADAMKNSTLKDILVELVGDYPKPGLKLVYMALDNETTGLAKLIEREFTRAGEDTAELKAAWANRYTPKKGEVLSLGELMEKNNQKLKFRSVFADIDIGDNDL